jgi:hypothetical protein
MNKITLTPVFGDDPSVVTLHYSNSSTPTVVGVLGVERDDTGEATRIYLNAKIHSARENSKEFTGWRPWGAVSTVLDRVEAV